MTTPIPTPSKTFRELPKTYIRATGKSADPCFETFSECSYIDAHYRLFDLYQIWRYFRRDQNNKTDNHVVDDWLKEYGASHLEICWYNHTPFVSAKTLWDFYLSICQRDLCRSWCNHYGKCASSYIKENGILAFYKEYDICEFPELLSEPYRRD